MEQRTLVSPVQKLYIGSVFTMYSLFTSVLLGVSRRKHSAISDMIAAAELRVPLCPCPRSWALRPSGEKNMTDGGRGSAVPGQSRRGQLDRSSDPDFFFLDPDNDTRLSVGGRKGTEEKRKWCSVGEPGEAVKGRR